MRTTPLIIAFGLTTALAGCGGGSDHADKTTIINQTIVSSAAPSAAGAPASATSASTAAQTAGDMPQPPAGATMTANGTDNGVAQAKYSINDQLPVQVMEYYTNLWRKDGYTIVNSVSGPDSGRKGGATAVASKDGMFIGVEADADPGEPTHFDVCKGASEMAVRDCID